MGWCWQTGSQQPCHSTRGGDWHQQLQGKKITARKNVRSTLCKDSRSQKFCYWKCFLHRMGKLQSLLMNNWRNKAFDRGWDGWMTSLTRWMWVCANSGRWWRTGKPRMLQSIGSDMTEWLNNNQAFDIQSFYKSANIWDAEFYILAYLKLALQTK